MALRLRLLAVRAGPLAALVLLGTVLVSLSSLLRMVAFAVPPWWIALGLAVVLLPALLARGSPLPATLAALVPVLGVATYGASRLDWLRTLKDFHVAGEGPDALRIALGLAALLLAWALHALDTAFRLRWRSAERGILPAQARAAMRVSLRRSGLHAAFALAGALLLVGLTLGAALAGPLLLPVERMAFLAPLLAALLLVAAALLLVGVPKREASADEGEQVRL